MNNVTDEQIRGLYIGEDLSMKAVAEQLNVSVGYIHKRIHNSNIEAKPRYQPDKTPIGQPVSDERKAWLRKLSTGRKLSAEARTKISEARQQSGIGHKKIRSDGYVAIYFPDHPNSTSEGYILEHILVMEAVIGRHLKTDECVHHINHKRSDNRAKNLKLMTKSEHMSFHMKERHKKRRDGLSTQ